MSIIKGKVARTLNINTDDIEPCNSDISGDATEKTEQ